MQLSLKQTWFAGRQIHIMLFLAITVMIWKKEFFLLKAQNITKVSKSLSHAYHRMFAKTAHAVSFVSLEEKKKMD